MLIIMKCNNPNCRQECIGEFCSDICEQRYCNNIKRFSHKQDAVNYLGGKCKRCGFNEDIEFLHFHHLDPSDKKYEISKFISKGFNFVRAELNKCILLCKNCHAIIHKNKDPKYFLINNYFFSIPYENIMYNLIKDNNDKCTTNYFEQGKIKKRNSVIPRELQIH